MEAAIHSPRTAFRDYFLQQGFLPMGIDSFTVFKQFDVGGTQFHELTATVSSIWAFGFDAVYKIIEGYLCSVWFYKTGQVYFVIQPPRSITVADRGGASLSQLLETLYSMAAGAGISIAGLPNVASAEAGLPKAASAALQLWAVDEGLLAELQQLAAWDVLSEYSEDCSEYVYRTADIIEWNGGVNLNKRNSLKRCFNTPDVVIRPLTKENFSVCFAVEDEWCTHQDCDSCRAFAGCLKDSLKNMAVIFDNSIYDGIALYIDDKPAGYAIWEMMNGVTDGRAVKTAYIYFAKSNVTNFNVYLYYMAAKEYLTAAGVECVNNGYDMGKPGLRTFKKHLSVHELRRKYLCTLNPVGL
ncbi:hypothetical protein FACS189491_04000 [Spirochaetia bacterium]|nr:hypothetical protein FACS189491_04000 [Spirochaetia bacterium]